LQSGNLADQRVIRLGLFQDASAVSLQFTDQFQEKNKPATQTVELSPAAGPKVRLAPG
jgi:hypothetical protein